MEMWVYEDRRYRKHSRMKIAAAVIGSVVVGVAGAGASAYGASTQASAAEDASKSANATQLYMYNQNRDDQAPYRQAGYGALNQITSDFTNQTGFAKPFDMNSFYSDPGYQFQLQQGTNAINNSYAAKGGLLSGAAVKAADQYTTGLANTTYGDAYNRYLATSAQQYNQLAGVAGLGQTSVAQTGAAGTSAANSIANTTYQGATQAANARASGYVGATNALGGAANSLGNYYALQNSGLLGGGGASPYQPSQTANELSNY